MASSMVVVPPSPFTSSTTLAPRGRLEIGEDRSEQALDHASAGNNAVRSTPCSPWIPRPSSIFRRAEVETRAADIGHRAAPSATPMVPRSPAGGAGKCGHLGKAKPRSRGSTGDLVDQHRACDAAATVARHGVAQCHVVGHDDDLDRMPWARASSAARPKFRRSPV